MAQEWERTGRYPAEIVETMKRLGLFGLTVPAEYGGLDADMVSFAIVFEEISRRWMGIAGILGSHTLACWLIARYGTDDQKRGYLPGLGSGELRSGIALTEPGAGTDLQGISTRAVADGDSYVISGTKTWITLRSSLERLLLAPDRGDPRGLTDSLLEIVDRPEELDEYQLERALGRFMARHLAQGMPPDLSMFTDLFRIVVGHGLRIPAEIAAVFRALATLEGTLTQLAPGFDVIAGARDFAGRQLADQLSPAAIRDTLIEELAALLPVLRGMPRHVDRIAGALEHGRLSISVRLLADRAERQTITGLLHQVLITALAASAGIMAVLMLGLHGGPRVTPVVSLYQFFGYCLLVIAGILALRVLVMIFRSSRT